MENEKIIVELLQDVAKHGEAIEAQGKVLDKHLNHGHVWRLSIVGLALTIIINVILTATTFGKVLERLDNTAEVVKIHVEKEGDSKLKERVAILEYQHREGE